MSVENSEPILPDDIKLENADEEKAISNDKDLESIIINPDTISDGNSIGKDTSENKLTQQLESLWEDETGGELKAPKPTLLSERLESLHGSDEEAFNRLVEHLGGERVYHFVKDKKENQKRQYIALENIRRDEQGKWVSKLVAYMEDKNGYEAKTVNDAYEVDKIKYREFKTVEKQDLPEDGKIVKLRSENKKRSGNAVIESKGDEYVVKKSDGSDFKEPVIFPKNELRIFKDDDGNFEYKKASLTRSESEAEYKKRVKNGSVVSIHKNTPKIAGDIIIEASYIESRGYKPLSKEEVKKAKADGKYIDTSEEAGEWVKNKEGALKFNKKENLKNTTIEKRKSNLSPEYLELKKTLDKLYEESEGLEPERSSEKVSSGNLEDTEESLKPAEGLMDQLKKVPGQLNEAVPVSLAWDWLGGKDKVKNTLLGGKDKVKNTLRETGKFWSSWWKEDVLGTLRGYFKKENKP